MKISLSLAQMKISLGNRDENIQKAHELILEAANRQSSLILFPELWSSGYDLENGNNHAVDNNRLLEQLIKFANKKSIIIGVLIGDR